jgi:glycosyltransferase involved in cell wall biosynthesis
VAAETFMPQPFISVVTPFRNTASYLTESIESVLAQGYDNFEYILSDNCSTDGSREIAESYAKSDSRIRLINQPELLSQVGHYNRALTEISPRSQYCKIVQADDYIFPECLRLMVQVFEQSDTIGIVSSYDLKDKVRGSGFPYPATMRSGRDVVRLYLRNNLFVFGSPNTVMYRSSLVRDCRPFFAEDLLHEDTEKCLEILEHWDFGFVHQVLSFMRTENIDQSISGGFRDFRPNELDRYINVRRYATTFLDQPEADLLKSETKRRYYHGLAEQALHFRGAEFWTYQEKGLATLNERLDRPFLTLQIVRVLLGMALNPGTTAMRILRFLKRRIRIEYNRQPKPVTRSDDQGVITSLSDVINADH